MEADSVLMLNILLLSFSALSFSASVAYGPFSSEDSELLIDIENMNQKMGHTIEQDRYR